MHERRRAFIRCDQIYSFLELRLNNHILLLLPILLRYALRMRWRRRRWWWRRLLYRLILMLHHRSRGAHHRHRHHRINGNLRNRRRRRRWRHELRNRRRRRYPPILLILFAVPAAQNPTLFHPHILADVFARHVHPPFQHRLRVRLRFAILLLHPRWRRRNARLLRAFPVLHVKLHRPVRLLVLG